MARGKERSTTFRVDNLVGRLLPGRQRRFCASARPADEGAHALTADTKRGIEQHVCES